MVDLSFINGPIEIVGCHAAGEVGDVIVGGIDTPPGATIWDQSRWIDRDQRLRKIVLNEPRGGVFRHVNLLVPPVNPAAHVGFIIMEPEHSPPMSGSNCMCVATVVLETGIVEMVEPVTTLMLEAPAGVIEVRAECAGGKVTQVTLHNVPSFAPTIDAILELPGRGELRVDVAFGGDSFVLVNAADLGLPITRENGRELAVLGAQITRAANEQLSFEHPTMPDWDHLSFCQIAEPLEVLSDHTFAMTSTSVIDPAKLDRSPTGTGVSARLALLRAQGVMSVGDRLLMRSVIGSEFVGVIESDTTVGDHAAIVPLVSGTAWRTGRTVHEIDPTDPWPLGYRITDTWPARPE